MADKEKKAIGSKVVQKGGSTFKEFKEFISKGNIFDMAVGVIIGGAFGKIVTSLVDNIIMPLVGMIIGGIVGNLVDRIFRSYVIDFLDFRIFGYHYPVFNLADIFIVLGIILMIILSMRKEYHERNSSR